MTQGRTPSPVHLRALDGGAANRPEGSTAMTKVLEPGLPECPAHLKGEQVKEWRRVAPALAKVGLCAEIYRGPLAAYCVAWGDFVEACYWLKRQGKIIKSPNNYPIQNPWLAIRNKAMEQMLKAACEFGMTPASLARASQSLQPGLFDHLGGGPGDGREDAFGQFLKKFDSAG